jgi:hypothetical protein
MNRIFGRIRSFGDKITLAVTVTSGIAVIAATVPLAVSDYANLKRETVSAARSHAAMVALDSAAALVFDDPVHAEEALAVLRAVPDAAAAVLFDAGAAPFASYQRAGDPAPLPAHSPAGERFDERWLVVAARVADLGTTQGQLQIVYDLAPLGARLRGSLLLALLVAVGAMVVASVIAKTLRRGLAEPVEELAGTAITVARTGDYSRRATRFADD